MNESDIELFFKTGDKLEVSKTFDVINYINSLAVKENRNAWKYVLRLHENRQRLPLELYPAIDDLLLLFGYYQYVNDNLNLSTQLNKNFFKSENLKETFFHRDQFLANYIIQENEKLILSAPTSFGKSLLIEEVVASGKYDNIVIIQPTLALIDETRHKLKKYSEKYKLIFSKAQSVSSRNIFLLTQERLVDYKDLPDINFFIIDEFYKLSLEKDERAFVLNHAFYLLLQHTKKFYLLGPSVDQIPAGFEDGYSVPYLRSSVNTVTTDYIVGMPRVFEKLEMLLKDLSDPTLIYCSGPPRCETMAKEFASTLPNIENYQHKEVEDWIKRNLHSSWSLIETLKKGVAFHHGVLPRHIGRYLVKSFNEGNIKYLFCTTTLVEGVNTSAKNVVIWDLTKAREPLNSFDIKNISGRAGRMGRYINGKVFVFGDPPQDEKYDVDFSWYTQESAPTELLIQLNDNDLKPRSKEKVENVKSKTDLNFEIIRKNSNISIEGQLNLARSIRSDLKNAHSNLNWKSYPTWPQLKYSCNLIWDNFIFLPAKIKGHKAQKLWMNEASSGSSLAFLISRYQQNKSLKWIIDSLIRDENVSPDEAIRKCMSQAKQWFEFRFPKFLMCLDSIQKSIFVEQGLDPGDYTFFAGAVENGFVSKGLATLKELGVPIELSHKLEGMLTSAAREDADLALAEIRNISDTSSLEPYEILILKDI